MKTLFYTIILAMSLVAVKAYASQIYCIINTHCIMSADSINQTVPISITVAGQVFSGEFFDNHTGKSLLAQLPLITEMEDYAGAEKIFYPPNPLNEELAPKGASPQAGDIMYYAPWGDVAIFYKDFRFANGLIPLGTIHDIDKFERVIGTGKAEVLIEIVDNP